METPGRTEPRPGNVQQASRCLACSHCPLSCLRRFNSPSSIEERLLGKFFPRFFDYLRVSSWLFISGVEEVLRARKESVHSRRQPQSSYSTCSCYSPSDHPSLWQTVLQLESSPLLHNQPQLLLLIIIPACPWPSDRPTLTNIFSLSDRNHALSIRATHRG